MLLKIPMYSRSHAFGRLCSHMTCLHFAHLHLAHLHLSHPHLALMPLVPALIRHPLPSAHPSIPFPLLILSQLHVCPNPQTTTWDTAWAGHCCCWWSCGWGQFQQLVIVKCIHGPCFSSLETWPAHNHRHPSIVETMKLQNIIVLQNKADLIQKQAMENYHKRIWVSFVKGVSPANHLACLLIHYMGTVAKSSPIVPISTQLKTTWVYCQAHPYPCLQLHLNTPNYCCPLM